MWCPTGIAEFKVFLTFLLWWYSGVLLGLEFARGLNKRVVGGHIWLFKLTNHNAHYVMVLDGLQIMIIMNFKHFFDIMIIMNFIYAYGLISKHFFNVVWSKEQTRMKGSDQSL